jgi:hypothetical protein
VATCASAEEKRGAALPGIVTRRNCCATLAEFETYVTFLGLLYFQNAGIPASRRGDRSGLKAAKCRSVARSIWGGTGTNAIYLAQHGFRSQQRRPGVPLAGQRKLDQRD